MNVISYQSFGDKGKTKFAWPQSDTFATLIDTLSRKIEQISLRNPKTFRTFEPFKFSNAKFFYPYKQWKNFERDLLSSDSVAKSATQRLRYLASC